MTNDIYITNAGLVTLNAYLSFFFQQCGLMEEDNSLSSTQAKRAALLLQYVYQPDLTYREEELVLNKLLCGLDINTVLANDFEATEIEKEVTSQMLDAIISHWSKISNSSHEGFRESWLQREGKLTKKENSWELLVENRAFDLLLDNIPFTLSPIQFSWMEEPLIVGWR